MAAMEKRLVEAITTTDAQALLDQWLPFGIKGMEQWQSMWGQIAQSAAGLRHGRRKSPRISRPGAGRRRSTHRRRAAGRAAVGVLRISGPWAGEARRALTGARRPSPSGGAAPLARPGHRRNIDRGVGALVPGAAQLHRRGCAGDPASWRPGRPRRAARRAGRAARVFGRPSRASSPGERFSTASST